MRTLKLVLAVTAGLFAARGGSDDEAPFTRGVSTRTGAAMPGYVDGARKDAQFSNPVNVDTVPYNRVRPIDFD